MALCEAVSTEDVTFEVIPGAGHNDLLWLGMEQYFAAGHAGWLAIKHGRRINLPKEFMDRSILVLWFRACLLNTDRLLGQEPRDADKPFFSVDGLYDVS